MTNPTTAGSTTANSATANSATANSATANSATTDRPVTAAAAAKGALASTHGATVIADVVVQKVAGLATREVPGVHALGGGTARAFSALRERIPGASASAGQGVAVEVGERQAAIDLQIVVEYAVSIADVARSVRRNVITAVEKTTGLEVVEVNISVADVHVPGADEGEAPVEVGRVH